MNTILTILIASACYLGAGGFSFDSQVGTVDADDERRLCLLILNPNLSKHTKVNIVLPHKPQRVAAAIIEEKATQSCSRDPFADANASFYWLKLVGKPTIDLSEPLPAAIAIIDAKNPIVVRRGIASGDLDGNGTREFFRTCTSSEGSHLTVWSGKPLTSRRRWHSYYYLGYDVVSTCKKRDYE